MRIVLLGPPGAGKGTQAVLLAERLSVPHISTGDMMRGAVESGSDLGLKVKGYLDSGALVPDEVVIEVVGERLKREDCLNGFILDGFPRTVPQAQSLDTFLEGLKTPITHVLKLSVAQDILIDRIRKRGIAGSGRSDDTVEVATKRLSVYMEQTAPLVGFYKDQGLLVTVDGLGTIDEVTQRISASLK